MIGFPPNQSKVLHIDLLISDLDWSHHIQYSCYVFFTFIFLKSRKDKIFPYILGILSSSRHPFRSLENFEDENDNFFDFFCEKSCSELKWWTLLKKVKYT